MTIQRIPTARQLRALRNAGIGRNAEKRAARAAEVEMRAGIVATTQPSIRVAKRKRTLLMINMLANRRLRQRLQVRS